MAKIKFQSKKEVIYEWILNKILLGEFAPNATLVIDDLAKQLSTSPIPVREALQQLEAEGFVFIKPYTGVQVSDIKPEFILEVFSLLETAETISGQLACLNMSEENLEQVEQLLREMDALLDDPDAWSDANAKFHGLICKYSKATLVNDVLARMLLHWDRLRRRYLEDVFGKRISNAQEDHWKMFEAIKAHDLNLVEEIARKHNQSALSDYIIHLRSTGILSNKAALFWTQQEI